MKKIVILTIILLAAYEIQAQMAFGIPVDFTSLNSVVYNPGVHGGNNSEMWVTDRTDEELSVPEKMFLNGSFEEIYPGHIILDEATVTYNCHGYSFGLVQGTDRYNISWSEDICAGAFALVTTPQKNDIAVIRDYEDNTHTNFVSSSIHSSVVVNEDTLISKWGNGPLTKHHKNDVIGIINLGTTLQAFLQSGKLTDADDLTYIYDKARKL